MPLGGTIAKHRPQALGYWLRARLFQQVLLEGHFLDTDGHHAVGAGGDGQQQGLGPG